MVADFHLHTSASDGELDPAALVAAVASRGVRAARHHRPRHARRLSLAGRGGVRRSPPPRCRADGRDRAGRRPRWARGPPAGPRAGPRRSRPRRPPRLRARGPPRAGARGARPGAGAAGGERPRRGGRVRPGPGHPDAAPLHPAPRRARLVRHVPGRPGVVPRERPGRGPGPQGGDGRGDRDDPRGRGRGGPRAPRLLLEGRLSRSSRSWRRCERSASTESSSTTPTPPARPSCSWTATRSASPRRCARPGKPSPCASPAAATRTGRPTSTASTARRRPERERGAPMSNASVIPRSFVSPGDEESAGPPADPSHADASSARDDDPAAARLRRATAQTVDDVVRRYLEARGGIVKLRSVQTLRLTGHHGAAGGDAPRSCSSSTRPGRMRTEFTVEGQKGVRAWDGRTAWEQLPLPGERPRPMSPEDAAEARAQADVDFSPLVDAAAKGYTIELMGRDRLPGGDTWKLVVRGNDVPAPHDAPRREDAPRGPDRGRPHRRGPRGRVRDRGGGLPLGERPRLPPPDRRGAEGEPRAPAPRHPEDRGQPAARRRALRHAGGPARRAGHRRRARPPLCYPDARGARVRP